MASYPDIRAPLRDSWRSISPDGVRRTAMDVGPEKTRLESTADPYIESWTHKLTSTHADALKNFYDANKAVRFDLPHWIHGACEAQFSGPIEWSRQGRWHVANVKAKVYL